MVKTNLMKKIVTGCVSLCLAAGLVLAAGMTPASADTGVMPGIIHHEDSSHNVFLGGNYIEVGVAPHGSFGTTLPLDASYGFHNNDPRNHEGYNGQLGLISDGDGWDTGEDPVTGDFFTPGNPYEGWMLSYKVGGEKRIFHYCDMAGEQTGSGQWKEEICAHDATPNENGEACAIVSGTTIDDVVITLEYSFGADDLSYLTKVTVENKGNSQITDLFFGRQVDPDQDQWVTGSYNTWNKIICAPNPEKEAGEENFAMIVSRGVETYAGFFYIAFDNRAKSVIGPNNDDPESNWYSAPTVDATYADDEAVACSAEDSNGYSNADCWIGIYFNLGDVNPGALESCEYYSSLDPNVSSQLEKVKERASIRAKLDSTSKSITIGEVIEDAYYQVQMQNAEGKYIPQKIKLKDIEKNEYVIAEDGSEWFQAPSADDMILIDLEQNTNFKILSLSKEDYEDYQEQLTGGVPSGEEAIVPGEDDITTAIDPVKQDEDSLPIEFTCTTTTITAKNLSKDYVYNLTKDGKKMVYVEYIASDENNEAFFENLESGTLYYLVGKTDTNTKSDKVPVYTCPVVAVYNSLEDAVADASGSAIYYDDSMGMDKKVPFQSARADKSDAYFAGWGVFVRKNYERAVSNGTVYVPKMWNFDDTITGTTIVFPCYLPHEHKMEIAKLAEDTFGFYCAESRMPCEMYGVANALKFTLEAYDVYAGSEGINLGDYIESETNAEEFLMQLMLQGYDESKLMTLLMSGDFDIYVVDDSDEYVSGALGGGLGNLLQGSYKLCIKFKDDIISSQFAVKAPEYTLSRVILSADGVTYKNGLCKFDTDGETECTPGVTVYGMLDGSEKLLTEGVDYELQGDLSGTAAGEYKITAVAKTPVKGEIVKSWFINTEVPTVTVVEDTDWPDCPTRTWDYADPTIIIPESVYYFVNTDSEANYELVIRAASKDDVSGSAMALTNKATAHYNPEIASLSEAARTYNYEYLEMFVAKDDVRTDLKELNEVVEITLNYRAYTSPYIACAINNSGSTGVLEFKRLSKRPANEKEYADGTFYVDRNGYLHIYSKHLTAYILCNLEGERGTTSEDVGTGTRYDSEYEIILDTMDGRATTSIFYNEDSEEIVIPTPERSGYKFAGWYLDEECNRKFPIDTWLSYGYMAGGDFFLFAKWEKTESSGPSIPLVVPTEPEEPENPSDDPSTEDVEDTDTEDGDKEDEGDTEDTDDPDSEKTDDEDEDGEDKDSEDGDSEDEDTEDGDADDEDSEDGDADAEDEDTEDGDSEDEDTEDGDTDTDDEDTDDADDEDTVGIEIEDPIYGDVEIEVEKEEGVAILPDMGEEPETPEPQDNVLIYDFTGIDFPVNGAEIPVETFEKLQEIVSDENDPTRYIQCKFSKGYVTIDAEAAEAILNQAEGDYIRLVVLETAPKELNEVQKEAIEELNPEYTFEAYFESNGERIHDFKGGSAEVSIKYEAEEEKDILHYHVCYVSEDGEIEYYSTRFENGVIYFTTTHFSDFAILYDITRENDTNKPKTSEASEERLPQTGVASSFGLYGFGLVVMLFGVCLIMLAMSKEAKELVASYDSRRYAFSARERRNAATNTANSAERTNATDTKASTDTIGFAEIGYLLKTNRLRE